MSIEKVIKAQKQIPIAKKTVLNILYTEKIVTDALLKVLKTHDLSIEQYNVLRILRGQNNKPINMSLIQERMLAKKSNTTRLVDKLLLKQLVERAICADNRRKMDITITPQGLDLLNHIDPIIENKEATLAKNLTEIELITLNNLLEKYRDSNHG